MARLKAPFKKSSESGLRQLFEGHQAQGLSMQTLAFNTISPSRTRNTTQRQKVTEMNSLNVSLNILVIHDYSQFSTAFLHAHNPL